MNTAVRLFSAMLLIGCCTAPQLHAQWTVTNLHPAGIMSSELHGAGGNTQVGIVPFNGTERAGIWSGTAASFLLLDPAGSAESQALGASLTNQCGWADVDGRRRASLWTGTAASWVDLNPSWAWQSWALDTSGQNQVGWAYDGTVGRAGLWSGTAESFVDLHPAGAEHSAAGAVHGNTQVGYAIINSTFHAAMWNGTAASFVDLNPPGAAQSEAEGVFGDYQVGFADIAGQRHAAMWHGTAQSWQSLHPPSGASRSALFAAHGPLQVGEAGVNFKDHASAWWGTPESWVDLHALLPPGYDYSYAKDVTSDGVNYYVVGFAYHPMNGHFDALVWSHPVAQPLLPEGSKMLDGDIVAGQIADLFEADDVYLELDPSPTNNLQKQKIHLILQASSSSETPTHFQFQLESRMIGGPVAGDVVQYIELFNYQTLRWETVDIRAVQLTDEPVQVAPDGDLSRFVQPVTREVTVGITWRSDEFTGQPYVWSIDVDQAIWMVGQ